MHFVVTEESLPHTWTVVESSLVWKGLWMKLIYEGVDATFAQSLSDGAWSSQLSILKSLEGFHCHQQRVDRASGGNTRKYI